MLSVLIPCQEDEVLLFPTLKSIFSNHFRSQDFEVLLICNAGGLVSERKVNEFPVQVHFGAFKGQAQALNWGLEKANGNVVCTTKPGCVVASDWLSQIARFFQRYPSVDGVGGPVLPCLDIGTKLQVLASEIFSEEQHFPTSVAVLKLGGYQGLFHATNSAFRKEALESVGFNEGLRYDYDFDACLRMLRRGYRLVFDPEMRVMYVFPAALPRILKRYHAWGIEGALLKRKYLRRRGVRARALSYVYPYYDVVRSFLQPNPVISTKKLLKSVQHLAYDVGVIQGDHASLNAV